MSGDRVRIGVIGGGWVATARHIPAIKRVRGAEVRAIMDVHLPVAETVAREFGIPRAFNDLDSFLREPLDAVSICTPPWTHVTLAETALRSGKHVLLEKPMTITSAEGRQLEELASQVGRILCPAHNFLFSRSMQKAEAILGRGKVGEVQWAMGVQLSSWQRRLPSWRNDIPGGLFFDEAPHLLYLMQHFLGKLAVEQAWHSGQERETSSRMEARLTGSRGEAYLTMWTGAPLSEWVFILFCSRSVLVFDLFRDILIHLPPEQAHNARDVLRTARTGTLQLWEGIGASGIRSARGKLFFGHDLLIRRFLDAVRRGEKSPVPPAHGWQVVALIEDILHKTSLSKG